MMAESSSRLNKLFSRAGAFLLSPVAVLLGMGGGSYIGMNHKSAVPALAPYGQMYMALLSMCIYPVLMAAISVSLASLVRGKGGGRRVETMAFFLMVFVLGAAFIGMTGGLVGKPGDSIPEETRKQMAGIVDKSEYSVDLEMKFYGLNPLKNDPFSISAFLAKSVPANIFEALVNSRSLQVLFFSIIAGLALGSLKLEVAAPGVAAIESFYHAFIMIIRWAMYPLPFGLLCLVAEQSSKIGPEILSTMARFLVVFYVCGVVFLAICAVVIWRRSGVGFWRSLDMMKEPALIALGTRNSLATLPAAIESLSDKLRFKENGPRLLVPLAVTIGRFGNVLYFALAGVFAAQLYGVSLSIPQMALILVCASLAGMATSGSTGVLTLTMLMLVLEPLRLPWEAVVVLFIAIDPMVDPLRTLLIVYPSCAFSAILSEREAEGDSGDAGDRRQQPEGALAGAGMGAVSGRA